MSDFHLLDGSLTLGTQLLLVASLAVALGFEFVNGFHDTANAVATVIYTRSLGPRKAVAWSGFCNFLGVYLGGTAVAFGIVSLLPVDLLVSVDSAKGLSMVMALLVAAIVWNLGTWLLAIPASSSHTLVGAILGVGMANSLLAGKGLGSGVNWTKAAEVGASLLISPLIGFACAAGLLVLLKRTVKAPELYQPPEGDGPPPRWIRGTLLLTSTGVSLAHGSNDGQKGIGLVMLILIGILPAHYALDPRRQEGEVDRILSATVGAEALIRDHVSTSAQNERLAELENVRKRLDGKRDLRDVPEKQRWELRADLILVDNALRKLDQDAGRELSDDDREKLARSRAGLRSAVYYAPSWVLIAVATALGSGTMIGWKRIVVTVGEKIGKSHLTYAQGAAAELVAMTTIGLADYGGLPVSTTHVLSSGVAGTMAANGTGLQWNTVRNIALAWVLTLPVSMALAAGLYVVFQWLVSS
ncbi:inorganic phosphate transporter [Tundrisphaera lichenicola]|uniref:inorganic phosphate transporter n=1 Tax=Tundrisphaera lichenicola TaxID=2029860 RepID=UPI003EBB00C6